jgi:hypothetical protein
MDWKDNLFSFLTTLKAKLKVVEQHISPTMENP